VNDVGRIGNLKTGDSELGADGTKTPEANNHFSACHNVFEEVADFFCACLFFDGFERFAKRGAGGQEVSCAEGIASLVVNAVEMAGVALDIEGYFLAVFDGKGADMRNILGRIGANIDAIRIGQLDGVRDKMVHLRVVNRNQPVIVFVFNPVFQNVFYFTSHIAS
jgi:hypothetical protein